MTSGVISGREYVLEVSDVERAVAHLEPEPIRDHYVEVAGRPFPPKQVVAAVLGLDRADFTTHQARNLLRRVGLRTDRRGAPIPRSAVPAAGSKQRLTTSVTTGGADALRPFIGQWVAVRDGEVIASDASPQRVVAQLRRAGQHADSLFRVPADPTADVLGALG